MIDSNFDIGTYNRYVYIFNAVLSLYISGKSYTEEIDEEHRILFIKYKKKVKKIYTVQMQVEETVKKFIKDEFAPEKEFSRSFEEMWEFCQFVRYAEKTVFYKNDIDNPLYVDSEMLATDHRDFCISDKDFKILFKLERIPDPINDGKYIKVITVKVNRLYGKNMMNEFIIVNQEIKYRDKSDVDLCNIVTILLYKLTYDTFVQIMEDVKTRTLIGRS